MSDCAVAPADPYIQGNANNSVVSVSSAQQSMTMTCWCRDAKPPPTITWLHNDVVVTSSSGETSSTADGRLSDAWSVVRVDQLRPQLSGDVYACRCENDASTAPSVFVVHLHVLGQCRHTASSQLIIIIIIIQRFNSVHFARHSDCRLARPIAIQLLALILFVFNPGDLYYLG